MARTDGTIVQVGDLTGLVAAEAIQKHALVSIDANGKLVEASAALAPIGIAPKAYALDEEECDVLSLDRYTVVHLEAAGAVAVGDYVETAADGEVAALGVDPRNIANVASRLVGIARTAGTDVAIEVILIQ